MLLKVNADKDLLNPSKKNFCNLYPFSNVASRYLIESDLVSSSQREVPVKTPRTFTAINPFVSFLN